MIPKKPALGLDPRVAAIFGQDHAARPKLRAKRRFNPKRL
jgi:hypothetical protein